ncbi:DNA glycosylase [Westerdykella ornata]|uniref:DNA glycosylase n=1 Tax=Westerdykella ornata TaxID=318751 RepID=A0A6A6JB39_WESOR|nr:DNA glycosylase [Westerdykella ornata]KAF2273198.1 DNA glycosylase [Westerdykella ornata]
MTLRRSARLSTSTSNASLAVPLPEEDIDNSSVNVSKAKSKTTARAVNSKKRKTKNEAEPSADIQNDAIPTEPPSTPVQPAKRARKISESPSKPPFTPAPAGIRLLAATTARTQILHPLEDIPERAGESSESILQQEAEKTRRKPRPAAPHATNAPLSTPGRSRKAAALLPPDLSSASTLPVPTSTIDTLLEDACRHLIAVDKKLEPLIRKHHCECKMFSPDGLREVVDPFTALASGIIGQQVSGQAAASIRSKFTALFPETHPSFPSPAQVLTKDLPTLRTAGLSQRKAEYIHGLAEKFASGELSAEMLVSASDEELIEKLVAVRGLGRWSVEMFACFGLKRMDVFSTGDLGVQRGMAVYMGRDVSKLKSKGGKWKYMTEKEMLDIAGKFSPYRSLFMWYMWRIEDVDISVLQNN